MKHSKINAVTWHSSEFQNAAVSLKSPKLQLVAIKDIFDCLYLKHAQAD